MDIFRMLGYPGYLGYLKTKNEFPYFQIFQKCLKIFFGPKLCAFLIKWISKHFIALLSLLLFCSLLAVWSLLDVFCLLVLASSTLTSYLLQPVSDFAWSVSCVTIVWSANRNATPRIVPSHPVASARVPGTDPRWDVGFWQCFWLSQNVRGLFPPS